MEHEVTLKFDRQYSNYHTDMIASFPASIADKIVALGVAHPHSENPVERPSKTRDVSTKMIRK